MTEQEAMIKYLNRRTTPTGQDTHALTNQPKTERASSEQPSDDADVGATTSVAGATGFEPAEGVKPSTESESAALPSPTRWS